MTIKHAVVILMAMLTLTANTCSHPPPPCMWYNREIQRQGTSTFTDILMRMAPRMVIAGLRIRY